MSVFQRLKAVFKPSSTSRKSNKEQTAKSSSPLIALVAPVIIGIGVGVATAGIGFGVGVAVAAASAAFSASGAAGYIYRKFVDLNDSLSQARAQREAAVAQRKTAQAEAEHMETLANSDAEASRKRARHQALKYVKQATAAAERAQKSAVETKKYKEEIVTTHGLRPVSRIASAYAIKANKAAIAARQAAENAEAAAESGYIETTEANTIFAQKKAREAQEFARMAAALAKQIKPQSEKPQDEASRASTRTQEYKDFWTNYVDATPDVANEGVTEEDQNLANSEDDDELIKLLQAAIYDASETVENDKRELTTQFEKVSRRILAVEAAAEGSERLRKPTPSSAR